MIKNCVYYMREYKMDYNTAQAWLMFFIVTAILSIIGYYTEKKRKNDEKKEKIKQATFTRENSENIDKFLNEISSFKKENNFSYEKALTIQNKQHNYLRWYYWTNKSSLFSVPFLGENKRYFYFYDNNNDLRKNQTNYILFQLREFGASLKPSYVPINYNEFDKIRGVKIALKDIVYFTEKGEIIKNSSVSGGGSSLGGAIVGGVLAGGLGAIIGSRKKINSEVVTTDNREVYLVYYEGKTITKKKFGYEMLEVFDKLIPEKNYEFIQLQSLNSNLNKSKNKKKSK